MELFTTCTFLELVLEVVPAELVIEDAVQHGHGLECEVRELVCQM